MVFEAEQSASLAPRIPDLVVLAAGKIKNVVDSSLYTEEDIPPGQTLVDFTPNIPDLLRARSDLVWSPGSLPKLSTRQQTKVPIRVTTFAPTVAQLTDQAFGTNTQQVTIKANKPLFKFNPGEPLIVRSTYNPRMWRAFIAEVAPSPTTPVFPPVDEPQPRDISTPLVPLFQERPGREEQFRRGPQNQGGPAPTLQGDFGNIFGTEQQEQEQGQVGQASEPGGDFRVATGAPDDPGGGTDAGVVTIPDIFSDITTTTGQRQARESAFPDGLSVTVRSEQGTSVEQDAPSIPFGATAAPDLRGPLLGQPSEPRDRPSEADRVGDAPTLNLPPPEPEPGSFNFIPTIDESKVFFDHAFEISLPFNSKQLKRFNPPIGTAFVEVKPDYNFFIENYEEAIASLDVPETLIPSMYSFLTELRNENTDSQNTIFNQHITLGGTIEDQFIDVTNNKGEKIGERDRGQYYDKYSRSIRKFIGTQPDVEANLNLKFTNQAVSISDIDLFKQFNEKREQFPMFFDVQFSTDKTTEFAEILKDSQLSSILIKDLIDGQILPVLRNFQETEADSVLRNGSLQRTTMTETKILNSWDITDFITQLVETPIEEFEPLINGVFLGLYNNEIQLAQNSSFDLFKNLLVIIFAGKVKDLVNRKLRSFEDITKGKLAYSETVLYRIEKRDPGTGRVLQNFWLPNSNDIDVFRFIDTQVKYNKRYTYEIFAYQLVIGSKYRYQIDTIRNDDALLTVVMEPSLQLVEVGFHEFTGRIMDNPPVSPDVNIIPFRAVNDEIKFNLNSQTGQLFLDPILIEPGDEDIIAQLREAQMLEENELMEFETDDHAAAFEIFRTDIKPRKWTDFTGRRIALVSTDISGFSLQKATSAAFIDNILPNKRYYYTFRAVDNHGHISNPTVIFELELVDADGAIFPVIRVVEFDKGEDTKVNAKAARRFIQIVPAFPQTILNEEKSGLVVSGKRIPSALGKEQFHLGLSDEAVWKKNFKIRLVSKQSGKKIDLNIVFDHTHVRKIDPKEVDNEGNTGA